MRKTILKLLTAVLLVLNGTMLFSQEKKVVKGVVSDSAGPIPGVGVVVDGTTNGVVTDIDGRYELKCNSGQTLEFGCMGYETVRVAVGRSDVYNVVLTPQSEQLDQVVFVGYGVQKKVNVTGSVTSVDYSKLDIPVLLPILPAFSKVPVPVSMSDRRQVFLAMRA